jgi:hypothetical protein
MQLAPGVVALCLLSLIATIDAGRMDEPMGAAMNQPWPMLLPSKPADVDSSIAMLQLRANVALARLIEAGHQAE